MILVRSAFSETIVTTFAPIMTLVAPARFMPFVVTVVPDFDDAGEKFVIVGALAPGGSGRPV
jgi:hypothetical protein